MRKCIKTGKYEEIDAVLFAIQSIIWAKRCNKWAYLTGKDLNKNQSWERT